MSELVETSDEQVADNQLRYYDNEWVRFVNELSKNEPMKKIAYYAAHSKFTRRAKRKIIIYTYGLLGRNLAITYIAGPFEEYQLKCDKAVIDAEMLLGMTNFDVTPEFQHITGMIQLQFDIMLKQARGGFERKQINTTERRISREEIYPQLEQNSGIKKYFSNNKEEKY